MTVLSLCIIFNCSKRACYIIIASCDILLQTGQLKSWGCSGRSDWYSYELLYLQHRRGNLMNSGLSRCTPHTVYILFLFSTFFSETGQKSLQLFSDTQQFVGATLSLHYLLTLDKIIGLFDFVNLYCVLLRRSCTVGVKNAFLWKQLQQTGLIGAV